MSLPSPWVDKIFAKLAVTYGQRFLGLYAGLDLQAVKDDWGYELRAYAQSPKAIAHALENLPTDKPPTVLEFRQLCRGAPHYIEAPKLESPRSLPPANMAAAIADIGKDKYDPKQWAHDLKDREKRDPKGLTAAQKLMWREALREGREAA